MEEGQLQILIRKCIKNDRVSQNALFHYYADHVMKISSRYAKDDAEAKAIFLNSFEKIFRFLHQFEIEKGRFLGWISKITTNEALSWLRQNKRLVYTSDLHILDQNTEPSIIEKLDVEYLLEIIQELSDPYRLIFNMIMDGYKHKEIAQKLGINESTSRSNFFRAREILKKKIILTQKQAKKWEKII